MGIRNGLSQKIINKITQAGNPMSKVTGQRHPNTSAIKNPHCMPVGESTVSVKLGLKTGRLIRWGSREEGRLFMLFLLLIRGVHKNRQSVLVFERTEWNGSPII
ncbi:hypothetical protein [Candidatus Williamhamiltonella defendens]|uniref:hypothetical protein n=1 Tax=Candidatus Williamhamiltonella defendens TaxID=138072 RepID=UPI00165250A3|nr:hypothetical protein [Candidatus Hamiltonella defensa]